MDVAHALEPPVVTDPWAAAEAALGPRATWPAGLAMLLQVMLDSRAPQQLLWGPDLRVIHNDAFAPILGPRRAGAMGRPLLEIWPELREELEALARPVLAGQSVAFDDRPFVVRRNGVDELAWFTFAWTPVRGDDGAVLGIHVAISETTGRILNDREQAEMTGRLTLLFEQAPGFIAFLTGPEHVFVLANTAYMKLVGQRELIGRRVADALPEVVSQGFADLLDSVFHRGTPHVGRRVPVDLVGDDGQVRTRYVDFVYQPVVDPRGVTTGIFVQGSDVTDQVLVEEALRERTEEALSSAREAEAERLRIDALLRATPIGIIYVDANGAIALANDAVRELWPSFGSVRHLSDYAGWTRWWADHGPHHGERIVPDDLPITRALQGSETHGALIEVQTPDDAARQTVLVHAAPVRDARGSLSGAIVTVQDMTERVEMEAQLRQSEAKFRTIADAMPQMVWSTLADGYHDYYNRQWYDFTGMAPGSTDGDGWNALFHPDDQARAWATWRHSLATGEDYAIEYRLRHHSGAYRWVLGRALALRDDAGRIVRWMGTCTDIHELRTLHADLQHSRNALALANERKDAFLATLAHELRNPLAPISAAAHILKMGADDPARVHRAGEIIERQVQHMKSLVDDITDVSRVTKGVVEYRMEPLALDTVLDAALEQVKPLIDQRGHRLYRSAPQMALFTVGDRTRLTQVFSNLLANAAKYTPVGGEIHVDAACVKHEMRVSIRDNGIGIDASLLPHVFELFTQAERDETRTQGGLGIGLAVVERIVQAHGGRVTADSAGLGTGSTFTVWLPIPGVSETD